MTNGFIGTASPGNSKYEGAVEYLYGNDVGAD